MMKLEERYQHKVIDGSVFRAYDIRGIIGEFLDEDAYYSIGRAISLQLKALDRQSIILARDGRLSSAALAKALGQGLLDSGINVIDIGEVATPVMYFATNTLDTDCGVVVTGSHNPAEYNGIKLVFAGKTLVQADMDMLCALVAKADFIDGNGDYEQHDVLPAYINRMVSDIKLERDMKIIVDGGNGVAGPVLVDVLTRIGCTVIPLYCDIDGSFPNHHPDPTVEANLADLKALVESEQADMGLAFDGDADRLGIVTNSSLMIFPDRMMMMYAQDVLKRCPGATIVYDVKCSSNLQKVIEAAGGTGLMCPTGHSIVKGVMKQNQAALAGEMSGHLFFKERWYGFDDALYSACRLLEILSQSTATVDEQFAAIPNSVNTPELKIMIAEHKKFSFMEQFCAQAKFDQARLITIDGLRAEFKNGWGLVRASNTTPCIVARFEADDEAALKQIQQTFRANVLAIDPDLILPF